MARIRSVHPGQWTDVKFVSCSPHARLLALALRNEADDRGVFVWEPLQLKMRLLPADNVDVSALLEELLTHNQVRKFSDESAKEYGVIRNFRRFQRPEKPKVVYPLPNDLEWYAGQSTKDGARDGPQSTTSRRPVDDQSVNSAPEGAGGGNRSRRRDSEREQDSDDGPQAVQPIGSTHKSNSSSLGAVSAHARKNGGSEPPKAGFGLEGQPAFEPEVAENQQEHPLVAALRRNRHAPA